MVTLTIDSQDEPTDYYVVVDGADAVAECNGDNNDDLATSVRCPVVQ